jgi:hypothetical protein
LSFCGFRRQNLLNGISAPKFDDGLHNLVQRMPPVVPKPTLEAAVCVLELDVGHWHGHSCVVPAS